MLECLRSVKAFLKTIVGRFDNHDVGARDCLAVFFMDVVPLDFGIVADDVFGDAALCSAYPVAGNDGAAIVDYL